MPTFTQLMTHYEAAVRKVREAEKKAADIRAEIVKVCPHPAEHRGTTRWHHGYGKYINSPSCNVCSSVDVWKTGKWEPLSTFWSNLAEVQRDWD